MRTKEALKWPLIGAPVVLFASFCATFGASEQRLETGSALSKAEAQALVDFHNDKRREVKVPGVEWSNEVAAFAQKWADHLAETGIIEHRPREGEWKQKYGENI